MGFSGTYQALKNSLPFWVVLLTGLLFFVTHIVGFRLEYFPGDMGDGRFNMYCLEHAHLFITGQTPSLWEAPFMFPEKQVITYSENLVGSAPIYTLFRLFGADREQAYQFWYIALCALNFTCAYFCLKSFTRNAFAAALGAFVFAFSLSLQSQMTHAQTFPRFAIPLAFWMAYLFYKDCRIKHLYLLLLATVLQFYCSIYLGMMLLPAMVILVIGILILKRRTLWTNLKKSYWIASVFSAFVVSGAALFILMWPYYLRGEGLPPKLLSEVWTTLPTMKSYVYAQPGSLLWDSLSTLHLNLPAPWDHQLFPGLISFVALFVGSGLILRNKNYLEGSLPDRKWMLVVVITMALTFLVFLRFGDVALYELLFHLPGFNALRSITRIINIELLFFACMVSFVFLRMSQIKNLMSHQWLVFINALGLLTADNYFLEGKSYHTEVIEQHQEMAAWGKLVEELPPGSIVSFEVDSLCENATRHQISAILCAQDHGLICINGYTATSPVGFDAYWNNPNEKNRKIWLSHMGFPEEKVVVIRVP